VSDIGAPPTGGFEWHDTHFDSSKLATSHGKPLTAASPVVAVTAGEESGAE
jgi:hypothetical protein